MDALKASLRVVLSNVRKVEIKTLGGARGRILLGNFNALQKFTQKQNYIKPCLIVYTFMQSHCDGNNY